MIFDNIKNASTYFNLSHDIKMGLEFILQNDLSKFENDEYEITSDKIKANVQEYQTKQQGKFEAHKKYIDIQYMIKGSEKMAISAVSALTPQTEYDTEKDVQFFEGKGDLITVPKGFFTIFYPQDAHMPCLENKTSELVKKVVIKILI